MDYQLSINNEHDTYCYIHLENYKAQLIICKRIDNALDSIEKISVDLDYLPLTVTWYEHNILCFGKTQFNVYSSAGIQTGKMISPKYKVIGVIYMSEFLSEYIYYTSIEPFIIRFIQVMGNDEHEICMYNCDKEELIYNIENQSYKNIINNEINAISADADKKIADINNSETIFIRHRALLSEIWNNEKCLVRKFGYIDRAILFRKKIIYTISSLEEENKICNFMIEQEQK